MPRLVHQHRPDVRNPFRGEDNLRDGEAVLRKHLADGIDHCRQVSVFALELSLLPDGGGGVLFCGFKLALRGGKGLRQFVDLFAVGVAHILTPRTLPFPCACAGSAQTRLGIPENHPDRGAIYAAYRERQRKIEAQDKERAA